MTQELKNEGGHTPGPWVYLDLGEVVLADDFNVTVATIDYSRDRAEADGHLIAAGPDLRAAVLALLPIAKAYVKDFQSGLSPAGRELLEALIAEADAALSKAEGRSHD